MLRTLCLFSFLLALVGVVLTAQANQSADTSPPSSAAQPARQDVKQDANGDLDADVELAVIQFVKEHQPELADLLGFLKKKKSKDYDTAMRESRKVRDRLMSIKARDSELYDVELAIWKNSAQIRLLAASVSAKSQKLSQPDHDRLKELIQRENELNIKRLSLEKARLESRLNQLSQQLTRRQEQAENVTAKSMKAWENRIEKSSSKSKKKDPL